MTSTIVRQFNGLEIFQRKEDGYFNLTQMADAAGRRVDNWQRLEGTEEYLTAFEAKLPQIPHIQTKQGRLGGTWAHPHVALYFAQWCSPDFALLVCEWVTELLTTGSVKTDKAMRQAPAQPRVATQEELSQLSAALHAYEEDSPEYAALYVAYVEATGVSGPVTTANSILRSRRIERTEQKNVKAEEAVQAAKQQAVIAARLNEICSVADFVERGLR